ncbi:MAG: transposase, partial [Anaerolineae bacterium]|nr:transposase [Anaerolineae bacterium]
MSIIVLKLPEVKPSTETRPKGCPHCHGETFQRWGKVSKPVKDNRIDTVGVYR